MANMSRPGRKKMAEETMAIIDKGGYYRNNTRTWVPIRNNAEKSVYYDEFFDFDQRQPTTSSSNQKEEQQQQQHESRSCAPIGESSSLHPAIIPRGATFTHTVTQETSNQAAERLLLSRSKEATTTTTCGDAQGAEQEAAAASSPAPRSSARSQVAAGQVLSASSPQVAPPRCSRRWCVPGASSPQAASPSNESPSPAPAPAPAPSPPSPSASASVSASFPGATSFAPASSSRALTPSLCASAPPASSRASCNRASAARTSPPKKVVILNYASAKNPGGGFLNGSVAQEECLARSSTLYPALLHCKQFYENWKRSSQAHTSTSSFDNTRSANVYTDRIIYSTDVCFFRNDDGDLLDDPYYADVITCASINRLKPRNSFRKSMSKASKRMSIIGGGDGGGSFGGAKSSSSVHDEATCRAIMIRRAKKVIQACVRHGAQILILGAWGTGVFGNETREAALWFREAFEELKKAAEAGKVGDPFGGIEEIVYAIPEADKVEEFREVLEEKGGVECAV